MNITYKKSLIVSFVSKGFLSFSGLVAFWIITNNTSQEMVGQYTLALTVLNMFFIFARFGLPEFLLYKSTKVDDENLLIKQVLFISLISSTVFVLLLYFSSDFISSFIKSDISDLLVMLSIAIPFMVVIDIFLRWHQIQQNINLSLIPSNIGRPFLNICILFILFYFTGFNDENILVIAFILSYMLIGVFYIFDLKKLPTTKDIRKLDYSHAYNNVFNLFLVSFILSIDSFMISYFYTDVEVAIYQVAIKVILITSIYNMIIEPIFVSRLITNKKNNNIKEIEKEHKIISLIGLFFWLSVFIVFSFFGEIVFDSFGEYSQSLKIFYILMIGKVFDLAFGLSSSVLNNFGYSKILLQNTILVLFLNLILNYLFIKEIGYEGVAYATSLVFILQGLLRSYQMKKYTNINTIKYIVPALLMVCLNIYYVEKVF